MQPHKTVAALRWPAPLLLAGVLPEAGTLWSRHDGASSFNYHNNHVQPLNHFALPCTPTVITTSAIRGPGPTLRYLARPLFDSRRSAMARHTLRLEAGWRLDGAIISGQRSERHGSANSIPSQILSMVTSPSQLTLYGPFLAWNSCNILPTDISLSASSPCLPSQPPAKETVTGRTFPIASPLCCTPHIDEVEKMGGKDLCRPLYLERA